MVLDVVTLAAFIGGSVVGLVAGITLTKSVPAPVPHPAESAPAALSAAGEDAPTHTVTRWKAHAGKPLRVITSDDGTTHYSGYEGGEALRVWEALMHGPALTSGVTWYENAEIRERVEAAA